MFGEKNWGGVNIEPMGIGSVPSCNGKISNKTSCLFSIGLRQATVVHLFSSICCTVRPSRCIFCLENKDIFTLMSVFPTLTISHSC